MGKLINIVKLLRPAQWIKNLFLFLPIFLHGSITELKPLWHCAIAFVMFCLTASAVYCINDSIDAPYDAQHPEKRTRPVASGKIGRTEALVIALILLGAVVAGTLASGVESLRLTIVPLATYFVLNLCYSFFLKRIPVVDVLVISGCFLIRLWAGSVASDIPLTEWTIVLVLLLTLLLATGKRRHEAAIYEAKGVASRSNIRHYNLKFLNRMLTAIGIIIIVVYLLWTFTPYVKSRFATDYVPATTVFVAVGVIRYLYLLLRKQSGGNPTSIILHDRYLQAAIICWVGCFVKFLYF